MDDCFISDLGSSPLTSAHGVGEMPRPVGRYAVWATCAGSAQPQHIIVEVSDDLTYLRSKYVISIDQVYTIQME